MAMERPGLSWRERRILAEVESTLRGERRLDRELSRMRLTLRHRVGGALAGLGPIPLTALAVLLTVSVLLARTREHSADVLAVFAAVWLATSLLFAARIAAGAAARRSRRSGR
ncbi:hypothetical protein [Streptomyces sp. Y1]|uniref:DUF3040 domain-containing protein n=1 Tax=Streptomyces sp. Y1 TaxID=3238634 RepID=A0AB39TVT7_9ACTN